MAESGAISISSARQPDGSYVRVTGGRPPNALIRVLQTAWLSLSLIAGTALAQAPTIPDPGPTIESFVPGGYARLAEVRADFNRDGLPDVVLVVGRPDDRESSRPLLVLLQDRAGGYVVSLRSDQAVPEAGEGGIAAPDGFAGLEVRRDTFFIEHYGGSSIRNAIRWQFQYRNSGWLLIGETVSISGAGRMPECPFLATSDHPYCAGYQVDTNFLTKNQIITLYLYDESKDRTRNRVARRSVRVDRLVPLAEFYPRPWADLPR
jgi:hypothetical protein